jgi:anaerobic ribonucleoside-triphosphate reductase activating protein
VTVTGGEPLEQADATIALARGCRSNGLSVVVFTGFTLAAIRRGRPRLAAALAEHVDVLVAGPYVARRRLAAGLRGSDNQRVHLLSGRYGPTDVDGVPEAEVVITAAGEIILTGVDPLARATLPA